MDYLQIISEPINEDTPCGVNNEDDSGFQNFFFEAEGVPEKYDGKNTVPAEPPDWRTVKKNALKFLKNTKDLRLICILTQAVLNTEDIVKFSQCLTGIATLTSNYWTEVYPPLDEDDGDPLERISALGHLSETKFALNALKNFPLAKSKVLGSITIRHINAANDSTKEKNDSDLDETQIRAIFKDNDPEEIKQYFDAINDCLNQLSIINEVFVNNAGIDYSVNFDSLINLLTQMANAFDKYADFIVESVDESNVENENDDENTNNSLGKNTKNSQSFSGQNFKLKSRQDVEKCIVLICDYFAENEPSSPIPLLVNRAKKLIHLNFVDIVKEIAPDAIDQIRKLGGISEE